MYDDFKEKEVVSNTVNLEISINTKQLKDWAEKEFEKDLLKDTGNWSISVNNPPLNYKIDLLPKPSRSDNPVSTLTDTFFYHRYKNAFSDNIAASKNLSIELSKKFIDKIHWYLRERFLYVPVVIKPEDSIRDIHKDVLAVPAKDIHTLQLKGGFSKDGEFKNKVETEEESKLELPGRDESMKVKRFYSETGFRYINKICEVKARTSRRQMSYGD